MGITGSKKKKQSGILKAAIVKDKVMVAVNGDQAPKEVDFDMNDSESDNETSQPTGSGKIPMKEKKRSRGFAFVDFADSERAMRCLEATNNVPGAFGEKDPKRRPIVEFSFDDVRKLQIQQQRAVKQAAKPSNEMGVKKTIEKKLSRGQKQRAKRRAEREAAAANHK
jgi:RNA recognition motif-containing protein